jgi:hypothetical protein
MRKDGIGVGLAIAKDRRGKRRYDWRPAFIAGAITVLIVVVIGVGMSLIR